MFQPSFDNGRILKQNMLEAVRDYPYAALRALYSNHGDGILSGFEICLTEDGKFQISPGILKWDGEVYVAPETFVIKQEDGKHYVYLKIQRTEVPDGRIVELKCQQTSELEENAFELFKYTKDAVMYEYKNIDEAFKNIDKPFKEPVNRIDQRACRFAVIGGATLCPKYYRWFAKEILKCVNAAPSDAAFAYQCLNGIDNIEAVKHYFNGSDTNSDVLKKMKTALDRLRTGNSVQEPAKPYVQELEKPKASEKITIC